VEIVENRKAQTGGAACPGPTTTEKTLRTLGFVETCFAEISRKGEKGLEGPAPKGSSYRLCAFYEGEEGDEMRKGGCF